MMEFLDKIYGYEHFGVILFAVIMFLAVLFVIILFFGKKDEKKREFERTQQLEKQNLDTFAIIEENPTSLEVTEPILEKVEEDVTLNVEEELNIEALQEFDVPTKEEEQPSLMPDFNESVEIPVLEPIIEPSIAPLFKEESPLAEVVKPINEELKIDASINETDEYLVMPELKEEPNLDIKIPDFNFDELAASIAEELSALEEKTIEPVIEPVVTNDVVVTPISEVVTPAPEIPKQQSAPVTFSSVYINKPAEEKEEPKTIEIINQPISEVMPKNIDIELPKPAEMPIIKEQPQNISSGPDFSKFEGESYNLK